MDLAKTKVPPEIVSYCIGNPRSESKRTQNQFSPAVQLRFLNFDNAKRPPSLLSLCLGIVGRNFEEIIDHLPDLAPAFPSHIGLVLLAIARRRKLLDDGVLIALADSSWEILDLSGSEISDSGLCWLVDVCQNIKAVDISRCSRITSAGVSKLLQLCHSLQTLRWGGCPRSEETAQRCLNLLKPNLNIIGGESWEDLDSAELSHSAHALRWLVWPRIDKSSSEILTTECPRIVVNPKPSPLGYRVTEVPNEALQDLALDDPFVATIDPNTWAVSGSSSSSLASRGVPVATAASRNNMSVAEKFRLAFLERDARLAPKRAKNARQHQRRAEREWMMSDSKAKASALASKAAKSLNIRTL